MKKIKSLLKKSSIALTVTGVLVAGVAGATLVNHLSNTVATWTAIESPLLLAQDEWDFEGDFFGGETKDFVVDVENRADAVITGDAELQVFVQSSRTGWARWWFDGEGITIDFFRREWTLDDDGVWQYALYAYDSGAAAGFYIEGWDDEGRIRISNLRISAGDDVQYVVRVTADQALEPGNYTFKMTIRPVVVD